VDAVPAKPGAFVEAAVGAARERELAEHLQQGALRGRAPSRQLELHGLIHTQPAETRDPSRHA
jgi:hypothetical protein